MGPNWWPAYDIRGTTPLDEFKRGEVVATLIEQLKNLLPEERAELIHHLANVYCKKGHPYEGDNLRVLKDGERQCVTCALSRGRRF